MSICIVSSPLYKGEWNKKEKYEGNIINIVNELEKNDKYYHSMLFDKPDVLYTFYMDIDKVDEMEIDKYNLLSDNEKIDRKNKNINKLINSFGHLKNVIQGWIPNFNVYSDDVKYTVNDNYKFGFHISIPKLHGTVSEIKSLASVLKNEWNDCIDMSVYESKRLYRLPNQSKGSLNGTRDIGKHIIQQGSMIDFIPEHIQGESNRINICNSSTKDIDLSESNDITPETQSVCSDIIYNDNRPYDCLRYCNLQEKIHYITEFCNIISPNRITHESGWYDLCMILKNELGDTDEAYDIFLDTSRRDVDGYKRVQNGLSKSKAVKHKWDTHPLKESEKLKRLGTLIDWCKEDNLVKYEKIKKQLDRKNQAIEKENKKIEKEKKMELDAYLLNMKPDSDNFINKFVHDSFDMIKFLRYLDNTMFDNKIEAYEYVRDNIHKVCCLVGIETLLYKNDDETISLCKLKEFPETLIKTEDYDPMDKLTLNKILFNNRNFICRYAKADVYPNDHDCPNVDFNLWIPFYCDTITDYTEMTEARDFLLNHIKIICNNVEESYNYVINWIANMLQYPWQKAPMLLFLSEQGAGKGAFIDLIELLIGKKKFHASSEPERDVWGNFNGLMVGKHLIHLEELSKKQCRDADHQMKKLSTSGVLALNEKHKGQTIIKSYHRFIISTNKLETVKIEYSDRRFFATECSNELIGNKKYFDHFYRLIKDPNVIKTMAIYFQSLNIEEVYLNVKIPMTPLKETLIELSKDKYQLWLDYYSMGKSGQVEVRTSECYEHFKKFAENNHMAINEVNMIKFGKYILNNKNVKKGKHTKYGNQVIIDVDTINKEQGIEPELQEGGEDAFEELNID